MKHKLISIDNNIFYQSSYFRVLKTAKEKIVHYPTLSSPLQNSDKIIFLDIDNILNRADIFSLLSIFAQDREIKAPEIKEFIHLKYPQFIIELSYLEILKKLQQQIANLDFVIISSWRKQFSFAVLKEFLSPLNIVGMISSELPKIEGIIDWWDSFIKDRTLFRPEKVVILDDNILDYHRPYTPGMTIKLVLDSEELDKFFKQCLLVPYSNFNIRTPNKEDMTEIRNRLKTVTGSQGSKVSYQ